VKYIDDLIARRGWAQARNKYDLKLKARETEWRAQADDLEKRLRDAIASFELLQSVQADLEGRYREEMARTTSSGVVETQGELVAVSGPVHSAGAGSQDPSCPVACRARQRPERRGRLSCREQGSKQLGDLRGYCGPSRHLATSRETA
jgi:hypothetical protein